MTKTGRRAVEPLICAPLRVEAWALRGARTPVRRTGMGPRRSAAARAAGSGGPVIVAGLGGGLAEGVRAGDIVVATAVCDEAGAEIACPAPEALAGALRHTGLTVHLGPIVSARAVAGGAARARLAATGALAVDTESFWLVPHDGSPFAVVRAVSDTAEQPLAHPGILVRGPRALRALRRAVPTLDAWASGHAAGSTTSDPGGTTAAPGRTTAFATVGAPNSSILPKEVA